MYIGFDSEDMVIIWKCWHRFSKSQKVTIRVPVCIHVKRANLFHSDEELG